MTFRSRIPTFALAFAGLAAASQVSVAQDLADSGALAALCLSATKCVSASAPSRTPLAIQSWMSPDVGAAWAAGYKGQGTTVTVVDDFTSSSKFSGTFGIGVHP